MGLFIFLLVVACVGYIFFWGKNGVDNRPEILMEKDDFSGDSIRSLFLLEEIVDHDDGDLVSTNHGFAQSEQIENDNFDKEEEYFEDEFFE